MQLGHRPDQTETQSVAGRAAHAIQAYEPLWHPLALFGRNAGAGTGERGVVVSGLKPDGTAAKAGIRPGNVILSFNRKDVNSPVELAELAERAPTGKPLAVLVLRDQGTRFLSLTIPEKLG